MKSLGLTVPAKAKADIAHATSFPVIDVVSSHILLNIFDLIYAIGLFIVEEGGKFKRVPFAWYLLKCSVFTAWTSEKSTSW